MVAVKNFGTVKLGKLLQLLAPAFSSIYHFIQNVMSLYTKCDVTLPIHEMTML